MSIKTLRFVLATLVCGTLWLSCGCGNDKKLPDLLDTEEKEVVESEAEAEAADNTEEATECEDEGNGLAYTDVKEEVWDEYGDHNIRIAPDATISHPELMRNRENCFIVMSKKDYYLYVYEAQGTDTVMLARYDCCFSRKKGQKEKSGDMKTPHCTMDNPFTISEIVDASGWTHDFGDGRGEILSYGHYFHRLVTPGHKGIGIHGNTNNEESVPGRASEGCIRMRDVELIDMHDNYAFVGMKVVIKSEDTDDYPFETKAMERQHIERKRHLNPSLTLTNEQVENTTDVHTAQQAQQPRQSDNNAVEDESDFIRENLTLEELNARKGKGQ